MLGPDVRRVLLEALRPPDGFRVDRAFATTYSLDLTALLMAPLAFSLFDDVAGRGHEAGAGEALAEHVDTFALLKAVGSYSERTVVFCQTGCISRPAKYRRLLPYLEGSVIEVRSPDPVGVFHPKLWALRMIGPEERVAYRVLCLSRNLTFDRSWDTALVLDGELVDRTRAFAGNHPLGDFFAALPSLAIRPMPEATRRALETVADELRRVRFEPPEGFTDVRFHPIGIEGYRRSPFDERIDRMLTVSPFVTPGALDARPNDVLVSRIDQLHALPSDALSGFKEVLVLDDGAEAVELNDDSDAAPNSSEFRPPPAGLHAKLYVADDGWNAHVWTGSANATTAALERNVEFLVQLTGKKSQVGVDATLNGRDGDSGLRPMLASYNAPSDASPISAVNQALEQRLMRARAALGSARWVTVLGEVSERTYPIQVHIRAPWSAPDVAAMDVWPISLQETFAVPVLPGSTGLVADFGRRSFDAITSFIAVRFRVAEGGDEVEDVFVVNAPIENAPEDRGARVLQSLLDDPAKVMRFLRLLLALEPLDLLTELADAAEGDNGLNGARNGASESPLLEAMIRVLDRDPARLDAMERVVRDLLATEDGRRSLPPEFLSAWEPIREARRALTKETES